MLNEEIVARVQVVMERRRDGGTERWRDRETEGRREFVLSVALSLRPPILCLSFLRPSISLSLCRSIPLSLSACASTQPVIKIGLVAPFEGRFRAIGYEAVYAARLAIREINARGGVQRLPDRVGGAGRSG